MWESRRCSDGQPRQRAIRRHRAPAHGARGGARPGLDLRRGRRLPAAAGGDRRRARVGLRRAVDRRPTPRARSCAARTPGKAASPRSRRSPPRAARSCSRPARACPARCGRRAGRRGSPTPTPIRARCRAPVPPRRRGCAPPSPSRSAARGRCSASWSSSPPRAVAPDDQLLATMSSLGSQIGQFVERCRAERGVHESEARKTRDPQRRLRLHHHDGRQREHRRGQRGHRVDLRLQRREEMVGRELAEIMIPPGALRDDHRRGLQRYMDTGASRIVGHPVELTPCAPTAATFPVELAVTRPDLPGPPLFCGYVRDVTERRRAEHGPAGAGRGAGRAAPGGDGGGRRGGARAAVRRSSPRRSGARSSARIGNILRFNGDGTALTMGVWSEHADNDPGRHDARRSTATRSRSQVWRTGRPARYRHPRRHDRDAWPSACARSGSRRRSGRP